jgi:hypothetical protein
VETKFVAQRQKSAEIVIGDNDRSAFNHLHKGGDSFGWNSRSDFVFPRIEARRIRLEKRQVLKHQIRANCEHCALVLEAEQGTA